MQPRSGDKMQPTTQAVGNKWVDNKPRGAKESFHADCYEEGQHRVLTHTP